MNNFLKNLSKNKKILVIGSSIIVLSLVGTLAFFSNIEEEANPLSSSIDNTDDTTTTMFSSYEVYNNFFVKLFKDSSNGYMFVDAENNKIFKTNDSIQYFRILNEDTIVYLTSSLNLNTNTSISEVKLLDLKSKNTIVVYSGTSLLLEVANDTMFIVDTKSGDVLYGTGVNLNKVSLSKNIVNCFSNKNKFFVTTQSYLYDNLSSTIYLFEEGKLKEVTVCDGKVLSINVDYNNDNIIYYTTKDYGSNENNIKVTQKYLVDLSADNSGTKALEDLNYNVFSLKDKYVTFDTTNNSILLLNNDFTKSRILAYVHPNMLKSLLNESQDSSTLYYINREGQLSSL